MAVTSIARMSSSSTVSEHPARRLLWALPSVAAAAIAVGLALMHVATPAAAQDGPSGIGFVQAEEGTWWCRAGAPQDALACARAKCDKESGGQECFATRWCYPAGWSALMIVWLPEFHSTHVVCGAPGRPAAVAALTAICQSAPEYTGCDLVLTIDPDGHEEDVSQTIEPGAGNGAAEDP